jgi:hypothetical protein
MARQSSLGDIAQPPGFGCKADKVKQRNGTETRHGRPEMLEFVRSRRGFYALDCRHRPVIARNPADHAA